MKEFIEKLVSRLEELQKLNYEAYETTQWMNDKIMYINASNAYTNAITIVNELADEYINTSTDTSSGWISVKDRLPTEEGSYLVVGKTGGATVTRWYMPNKFHPQGHFGGNSAEYIRYWMPRPQAPKYEPKENKKMTNAQKIRSMTDEELAEFLLKVNTAYAEPCMIGEKDCKWEDYPTHDKGCKDCFLAWLQSEVEGGADD